MSSEIYPGVSRQRTVRFLILLSALAFLATGCALRQSPPSSESELDRVRAVGVDDADGATTDARDAGKAVDVAMADGGLEPGTADLPALEADPTTPDAPPVEEPQPGEEFTESPLDELALMPPDLPVAEPEIVVEVENEPQFDIPMVLNDRVNWWIEYYTTRSRDSFQAGLTRSTRYLDLFREIYAENDLPLDLIYMAHVESGYKPSAYSRARARGIFQFMAPTARAYGLKIDYWVDERLDPEKSARASAAYLRKLHGDFGDWYLVLAAYNAGEGKIRRALKRTGANEFWELLPTRHIRRETKNHVPAILAATWISKQPEKYGFTLQPGPRLEYETIRVEGAADLRVIARCAGTEVDTLHDLNPALRRLQTPPDATTDVRVPPGTGERALAGLRDIPRNERVLYARHQVRRGDTLSRIAQAYGVNVRSIQQSNGMGRRTMIRVGQQLVIPTSSSASYPALPATAAAGSSYKTGKPLVYRVRRGDTLSGIARRYGTSAASLAASNGMSVNGVLSIGRRLTVVPGVRNPEQARSIAAGDSPLVASAAVEATVVASAGGATSHVVRSGESLWTIARRYRTTVDDLCALNGISPRKLLHPGTRLTIRSN